MDMLKENCYITHLNLSENGLEAAGAHAVQEMLQNNSTVTHCYLSGRYGALALWYEVLAYHYHYSRCIV